MVFAAEMLPSEIALKWLNQASFMSPPNMFLFSVKYSNERKEIGCVFARGLQQKSFREKFFPYAFVSFDEKQNLVSASNSFEKKISFEFLENSIKVSASDFSSLNEFFSFANLSEQPLLIEPERQYLIQMNWSYFDEFAFEKNLLNGAHSNFDSNFFPSKLNSVSFPVINLDSVPLCDLLNEMLLVSQKNAKELIQKICLSNLLKVAPQFVPDEEFLATELFLQNSFFKASFASPKSSNKSVLPPKRQKLNLVKSELCEMNFNEIWSSLFSNEFLNLGFDSINCSCCVPKDFNEKNILSNSLVKVKFLSDGIMVSSENTSFASEFHSSNPLADARREFQKEFFLEFPPIGPFFSGQESLVPFNDAMQLLSEKKISVNFIESNLKWFCMKKPSFLSNSVSELFEIVSSAERKSRDFRLNSLDSFGMNYQEKIDNSPEFNYFNSLQLSANFLLDSLAMHLRSPFSRFYFSSLAESIDSAQNSLLAEFKKHASENNAKIMFLSPEKVFLQAKAPLLLSREFSIKTSFPRPKIIANWNSAVI